MNYIELPQPLEFHRWQSAIYSLAEFATVSDSMGQCPRRMLSGDAVYDEITFDLDRRSRNEKWEHPFSGCAYLPMWVFECALGPGHTAPQIGRGTPDKPVHNPLSKLAWNPLSEAFGTVGDPNSSGALGGSVLQCGSNGDSHVYLLLGDMPVATSQVFIAEYGQAGGADFREGAKLSITEHTVLGGRLYRGKRPVRRILSSAALFRHRGPKMRVPEEVAYELKI